MPSPHHVLFALISIARASGGASALDRAAGCPWGVPWGRGARVEVRRVWGIGGVVPMAAGGMGPHAFTAPCSFCPPTPVGGIGSKQNTGSSNRGCARLDGAAAPPLRVVKEEVTALVVLVRRHCCAVGAAVRRAVDDEVPGAVG